jgi:BirA family biotin operon repressor/biotin-[acetyl-CoA-carboxylase] ligase
MFHHNKINWNIIFLDEIDSTNELIKREIKNLPNYTVVVANHQTNGKGQFDRKWVSNRNENLLCSILMKDTSILITEHLNSILINTIVNTLQRFGISASYKSPNDIYVNDLKIAGILVERAYENKHLLYTIVGIGLNINQVIFPIPKATSMHNETKMMFQVRYILDALLYQLEDQLKLFSINAIKEAS